MKSRIFVIIGSVMAVICLVYLGWCVNNPTADIPFSLSYDAIWIVYRTYLAITELMFLTALAIDVINKRHYHKDQIKTRIRVFMIIGIVMLALGIAYYALPYLRPMLERELTDHFMGRICRIYFTATTFMFVISGLLKVAVKRLK